MGTKKWLSEYAGHVLAAIGVIVALVAAFYAWQANTIARKAGDPEFQVEYFTVVGLSNVRALWNIASNPGTLLKNAREDIGVGEVIYRIDNNAAKSFAHDDAALKKGFESTFTKYWGNTPETKWRRLMDTHMDFEILHIANSSHVPAKNVTFFVTESDASGKVQTLKAYRVDAAKPGESIFLLTSASIRRNTVGQVNGQSEGFGARSKLERIEFDGLSGRIVKKGRERFKENRIVKTIEDEKGFSAQCPFLYTRDRGEWNLESAILVGCDGPSRESTQSVPIRHFDGTLLLLETKREHSFIDFLAINATTEEGAVVQYSPNIERLSHVDQEYLKVREDEVIEVSFPGVANCGSLRDVTCVVRGYYIAW